MKSFPRSLPSGRQSPDRKGKRQSRLGLLAGGQSEPKDTCLAAGRRNPTDRPLLVKIKLLLPRALLGWVLSSRPRCRLTTEYKPPRKDKTGKVLISRVTGQIKRYFKCPVTALTRR